MLTGEKIVNAVADVILREFFPYPNSKNIHVRNAVAFMLNEEFLSFCTEENKKKIKNLADYCSYNESHSPYSGASKRANI